MLTPQEAEHLFVTLDKLSAEGVSILYISHKLEEVRRLCQTATILRAGQDRGGHRSTREERAGKSPL